MFSLQPAQGEHKQETTSFPLQAVQSSMFVFKQLHPNDTTYHHTAACQLTGKLNLEVLDKAFTALVERHENLRSYIVNTENGPQQVVMHTANSSNFTLQVLDASAHFNEPPPVAHLETTLQQLNASHILAPFHLEKAPLWRAVLIKYKNDQYQFLLVIDHIIVDVTSQNILMRDLSFIYNQKLLSLPAKPELATVKLALDDTEKRMKFWEEKHKDMPQFELLTDFSAPKNFNFKGDRVDFNFDANSGKTLSDFAKSQNVSVHQVFLACLYIILYRYSAETDICVGTASANRRGYNADIDNVANCFVNSIPLRNNLAGNPSFTEILQNIKALAKSAYENQLPLNLIIEKVFKTKAQVATPFDIILVLNEPKTKLTLQNVQSTTPIELNLKHSKFRHFGINLDKQEDGSIEGFIEYNSDLFKSDFFRRFLGHLKILLTSAIKNPMTSLYDLLMLTPAEISERDQQNKVEQKDMHFEGYTHEVFSDRASQTPDANAIVFHKANNEKEFATWSELDSAATRLASLLMQMGVGPEHMVGICVSRSISMLIAMLAVHKAGGAFVPLDTTEGSPLHYKMAETKADIVLVDNQTNELFHEYDSSLMRLNLNKKNVIDVIIKQLDIKYKKPSVASHDLASVFYTSGTEGAPKGVMVEFGGQQNLLNALADRKPQQGTKILCAADIKSDAIWFDITQWIAAEKAELHLIYDEDRFTPEVLTRIILENKIDTICLPAFVMEKLNPEKLRGIVKVAISQGSKPQSDLLERWYKCGIEIHNEWGPTENTVCSTLNIYHPGDNPASVGKPIRNVGMDIIHPLDRTRCPVGVPGEIIVKGKQLARGYLGDQSKTRKKFPDMEYIPDSTRYIESAMQQGPITKDNKANARRRQGDDQDQKTRQSKNVARKRHIEENYAQEERPKKLAKVYFTGDRAYYDENGNIIFLERLDNRVKINGYGIELEPMHALLMQHPNVKDIVISKHSKQEALIAYIVLKNPAQTITKKELNQLLKSSNLHYLARISHIQYIDKIPLKSNGKVDNKALSEPMEIEKKIVAPQNNLQRELLAIWSEIINISQDKISTDDDLIITGGDSLKLFRLLAKIKEKFHPRKELEPFKDVSLDMSIQDIEKVLIPLLDNSLSNSQPNLFTYWGQSKQRSSVQPAPHSSATSIFSLS